MIFPSEIEDMLWDDTYLPLFDCTLRDFVQTIYHADQLPRKPFKLIEIDRIGGLQILRLERAE